MKWVQIIVFVTKSSIKFYVINVRKILTFINGQFFHIKLLIWSLWLYNISYQSRFIRVLSNYRD